MTWFQRRSFGPEKPNSLSNNYTYCITQDKESNYWISTDGGLNRLDARTGRFTVYTHEHYLPRTHTDVHSAVTDQSGVVWLGSLSKGVLFFLPKPKKFNRYLNEADTPFGPGANEIQSLVKGSDGQVYVATTWSLLRFDPEKKGFSLVYKTEKEKGASEPIIFAAAEEKPGVFWLATYKSGIIRVETRTGKATYLRHDDRDSTSLANNSVDALLRDRSGVMWVGTWGGHLQWYDSTKKRFVKHPFRTSAQRTQSSEEGFRFLHEDRKGRLWMAIKAAFLGSGGGGLYCLDRQQGQVKEYRYRPDDPSSLSSDAVTCIFEGNDGILWLGTNGGGLNRLDTRTGKAIFYTEENGLQSNKVEGIAGDKAGNLWVSSKKGITFFNPSTLETDWFDSADGVAGSPAGLVITRQESGNATLIDLDGTVYFGNKNGLTVFHPARIYLNQAAPPLAINQVKVFDKAIPFGEEGIVLEHDQNFLDFEFAALSFVFSGKNQYAYLLEGVDKEWVPSGTRRVARYTNLPPGSYTFRVKGSNSDGVWNEQGVSLPVTIQPPWWRTWWAYAIYGLLLAVGIVAVDRVQRQRLIQKERERAREREREQAREIERAYRETERAYEELKRTQAQLVQREKMASLGELTAGIAHEIQNPLNFVNNFSEVSTELVEELKQEANANHKEGVLSVAADLEQNLQKIYHHGQRADAIVKNMLQHSRTSAGQKQPTDLNALAEEYLRLAYHGLRAKDKAFTCTLITEFDRDLGMVEAVPQELGRVLMNLYNNAFYAVQQKARLVPAGAEGEGAANYQPTVKIRTRPVRNQVELRVWDNGVGISEKMKGKIFQPFFTTKPTGEGTGLGLSLSYDIITKGHGGELRVESVQDEYAEFIARLPSTLNSMNQKGATIDN